MFRSIISRTRDGAVGAIVVTGVALGGVAYAASSGPDDNPSPSDLAEARPADATSGTTSTTVTTLPAPAPAPTPAPAPPVTAPIDDRISGIDDNPGADDAPSTTVPAPTVPAPAVPAPTVPAPTPTVPAPAPEVQSRTVVAAGGTVTVTVSGGAVQLSLATPTAGWSVEVEESGPREVEVQFEQGDRESRVKFELEDGRLKERIEER